jgi:glycosyltransferase involved in cell wall biosynthesis
MRLLYIGDSGSPHFRGWAAHFAGAGYDVHALHLARFGEGGPLPGVTFHRPRGGGVPIRGGWRSSALSIRGLARRLRPAVVHSQQITPSGYLAELARVGPHVSTAWGSEVLLAGKGQSRQVARVARQADLLTAPSTQLLDSLRRAGADPARLRWVPFGISAAWRRTAAGVSQADARRRLGLPQDRPLVISPRGTRRIYRQDVVARAFARVADSDLDPLLLFSWPDQRGAAVEGEEQLVSLLAELGLSDRAILRGSIPHELMPLLYRAADVFVSVPESDGVPSSVIEAMMIGLPIIVSRLPWLEDPAFGEFRLGQVVVGDELGLAEMISERLRHPDTEAVASNRKLALGLCDRDSCFGAFEGEYARLAESR